MSTNSQANKRTNSENIIDYFRQGHTLLEASNEFSIPLSEIYARTRALLSSEERQEIREQLKNEKNVLLAQKAKMIFDLFENGKSIREVSIELGIPMSRIKRTLILGMLRSGQSMSEVATRFETNVEYVYGFAARSLSAQERKSLKQTELDLKLKRLDNLTNLILEDHKNNMRLTDIAKKHSVLVNDVKRIIKNFGVVKIRITPEERKKAKQQHLELFANSIFADYKNNIRIPEIASKYSVLVSDVKRLVKTCEQSDMERRIIDALRSGLTLSSAGKEFNLSRERIRQIAVKNGFNTIEERQKITQSTRSIRAATQEEIRNWVKTHPGCKVEEIAEISVDYIESNIPSDVHHLILDKNRVNSWSKSKYSNSEILEALQKAFQLLNLETNTPISNTENPLTRGFFDNLVREGKLQAPSSIRVMQIFGTWSEACSQAGVKSVKAVRDTYHRNWSDFELIDLLGEFLLTSKSASVASFDIWCGDDSSKPGSGTLRNQIGAWSECKSLALLRLRSSWTNSVT